MSSSDPENTLECSPSGLNGIEPTWGLKGGQPGGKEQYSVSTEGMLTRELAM
jgi:hypothetical protein